jgi:hypothetical protein
LILTVESWPAGCNCNLDFRPTAGEIPVCPAGCPANSNPAPFIHQQNHSNIVLEVWDGSGFNFCMDLADILGSEARFEGIQASNRWAAIDELIKKMADDKAWLGAVYEAVKAGHKMVPAIAKAAGLNEAVVESVLKKHLVSEGDKPPIFRFKNGEYFLARK